MFKKSPAKKVAKKSTTTAKSFLEEVSDVASQIGKSVREGSAQAIEATGPGLERANEFIHDITDAAGPKLTQTSDRLHEVADRVRSQAGPRLQELSEQGRDRAAKASERVTGYSTKAASDASKRFADTSSQVAGLLASASAPKGVEEFVGRVTGDKKAIKKAQKAAAKRAKDLSKQASKTSKELAKSNKKSNGWNWVVLVLALGAIGAIGYYVWKKLQPVNDPWSEPLPGNRPADARPLGSHDAEESTATAPIVSEVEVPAGHGDEEEKDASDAAEVVASDLEDVKDADASGTPGKH